MSHRLVITIDGPSGVGKGTVARTVAAALGYQHVDTGAMYRAVAWRAIATGCSFDDEAALTAIAAHARIEVSGGMVQIDGADISSAIRTSEIDKGASFVAKVAGVRVALVAQQRLMGANGGIVMEGRDIGTVVFPAADVKVFLDASPEERARRRVHDGSREGGQDRVTVEKAMAERDDTDRSRTVSPLAPAADACLIDTTSLTVEEVVARVLALVRTKQG